MKTGICLITTLILAGCASAPQAPTPVVSAEPAPLERSAKNIERMMVELNRLESGLTAAKMRAAGEPVTITYSGDAVNLVDRLAKLTNRVFLVTGRHPAPLPVSLDVQDRPVEEVLYLVGVQLGKRADILLDRDRIELRYQEWNPR